MSLQRPLVGEYKMVVHVSHAGRASVYLLHLPSTTSSYGNELLAHCDVYLSDAELLEGDWSDLIERCAIAAGNTL